ncbi:MAG: aldo/keto reductase [Firmicutes bacterium]|nr:aldo/keto reductase [Bacillota bacterium]
MQYRILPGTDLRVSAIGLGTAHFGSQVDVATSCRLLDRFIEQGGNLLDTARVYAAWVPHGMGASERTIGRWLRRRGNRASVVVATKGGHPDLRTMTVPRLDRTQITADCHASLRALGCDYIDLYWLHRDDESRPVDDLLETLEHLVAAGKIRWYGCSNWSVDRMRAAQEIAHRHGCRGFVANQPQWSLAEINADSVTDPTLRRMDAAMQRFHQETGMAVIPYGAQAQGFFSKAAAHGLDALPAPLRRAYDNPTNRRRLARLKYWADVTSHSVTALALGYLVSHSDFVTIPLIGAQHLWQLDESLAAADLVLPSDILRDLEAPQ